MSKMGENTDTLNQQSASKCSASNPVVQVVGNTIVPDMANKQACNNAGGKIVPGLKDLDSDGKEKPSTVCCVK